jgi:NitT/TauT family transport system permease protein
MPALIWNMMMSMSGGWFFVVASEALTVGHTTVMLPGVGSYIALAIRARDMAAVAWAVAAMAVVILVYDQLMFRPLVAWAERFRAEQTPGAPSPGSWVLTMIRRARLLRFIARSAGRIQRWLCGRSTVRLPRMPDAAGRLLASRAADRLWAAAIAIIAAVAVWRIARFAAAALTGHDVVTALALGGITFLRVAVLIALASAIWVPVGIYVGLRPALSAAVQPAAQFLAAFPANLLFPAAVVGIVQFHLDPDLWLSPLMILGTQWYVLFNVIAGAAAIPGDLRDVAANLGLRGWVRWRKTLLPAVFPYYVTGAITATGGSWNASIVAEVASWGDTRLTAHGIGAYIAQATAAGDHARIVLGIAVMSAFVIAVNRMVWRPLYAYAERRLRLD